MVTVLVIIHGLFAVALLGAITHQALATLAPARARHGSFFGRFRSVPSAAFVDAIIVLYAVSAILGAIVYFQFGIGIKPALENSNHWKSLGLFDIKEHFVAIGAALLPAYRICWRQERVNDLARRRSALTLILAFIVWWSFLVGHIMNNILGFGL
jgi:hypothetical protein